jgi:uncharacterized membrane protein YebE (DUF533 family)
MNTLKFIKLMFVFVLFVSISTNSIAQEQRRRQNSRQSNERVENFDRRGNHQNKQRCQAGKRNKVKKHHMRSMRRMAAADGKIHPRERKMMMRQRMRLNG